MRLTLRNLLAYLHGTLQPDQHEAFAQLVKSTPRVQLLVDRCVGLASRRLAAPDLEQSIAQYQPETVAKYLDFTLPDDQLAAFEKAALASDEQLAEIVDCHRILSDVVKERLGKESPSNRLKQRLLDLKPGEQTGSPPAKTKPEKGQSTSANRQKVSDFAPVAAAVQADLTDSGDLTEYLSDVDDDEELSLDVVRNRAKAVEQRAFAAAAQAYTSGGGTMTATEAARVAVLEKEQAYAAESPITEIVIKKKAPLPTPVLAGIGGGAVLVLGIVIWIGSSLFGGKPSGPSGPFYYGIPNSPGKSLCELSGTVTFQPKEGGPSPDAGALVVAWPVQPSAEANRLTTAVLLEDLAAKRQNPYNEMLVVAKCDDDGRYYMRMHQHSEFHLMVLSQRASTANPVTWGEAVEAIASQLEDVAALISNHKYDYRKVAMPAEHQAAVDIMFSE